MLFQKRDLNKKNHILLYGYKWIRISLSRCWCLKAMTFSINNELDSINKQDFFSCYIFNNKQKQNKKV